MDELGQLRDALKEWLVNWVKNEWAIPGGITNPHMIPFHLLFPKQHKGILRKKDLTHQTCGGAAAMAAGHPAAACACANPTLYCAGKGSPQWEEE